MIIKRLFYSLSIISLGILISSVVSGQESLSPLKINGALYQKTTSQNFRANNCNNLFLRYDTLQLEDFDGGFMDDFTTNSILGNHFPSAKVKDTLVYKLLNNNIPFGDTTFVVDTTYNIKITITPTDTIYDSVAFASTQISVNNLDTCPILTDTIEVWPSYNIFDTVSTNSPDTIFISEPKYAQDSLKTYIVWADSATRWLYGSVYVNPTMGIEPPSIQVATFDGLDNKGLPYDFTETSYGLADSLVSLPINLAKDPADSIYLSFYYQGGGISYNAPEKEDSLILHFYSPSQKKWNSVWNSGG